MSKKAEVCRRRRTGSDFPANGPKERIPIPPNDDWNLSKPKYHLQINAIVFILSALLLMTPPGVAADSPTLSEGSASTEAESKNRRSVETEFSLGGGYRRDDLNWNVSGDSDGNNPNVLSELTWEDLEIFQLKLENRTVVPKRFYFRAFLAYGWISDGQNQDSDFAGDDRTFEFSRTNNSADDGNVLDASVGVGYPFQLRGKVISTITPLVGYSLHEQNLTITDGNQTISVPIVTPSLVIEPPPLGPFPGLDSTYEAAWRSPWIGLDLQFEARERKAWAHRLEGYASVEVHWADFEAEADWNLREDFAHPKSFQQDADGTGIVIGLELVYLLKPNWLLNASYDYQDWSADDGTETVFLADGTTASTRLNEVDWRSNAVSLGILYRF